MADALGAIASISIILNLVISVVKLSRRIHKSVEDDERYNLIHWKLIAEKSKTVTWANHFRNARFRDTVPGEQLANVRRLCSQLDITFLKALRKFERVAPYDVEGRRSRILIRKMLWAAGGYDEMNTLVNLLTTMNTTLYVLAPLPSRYGEPSTGRQRSGAYRAANDPIFPHGHFHEPRIQPIAEEATSDANPEAGSETLEDTIAALSIRHMHRVCLEALYVLESAPKTTEAARAAGFSLRTWSVGMFDEPWTVDDIIKFDSGRLGVLRQCLVRSFGDIAVTQEQIFQRFRQDDEKGESPEWLSVQERLGALFDFDEVASVATERWQSIMEEIEDGGDKRFDVGRGIRFIAESIELLYELVTCIRAVRQQCLVATEKAKTQLPRVVPQEASTTQPQTRRLLENNIETIKTIEDVVGKYANAQTGNGGDSAVEARNRIQSQRARMERIEEALEDNPSTGARLDANREIERVQQDLARKLEQFSDHARETSGESAALPAAILGSHSESTKAEVKNVPEKFVSDKTAQAVDLVFESISLANAHAEYVIDVGAANPSRL